MYERGEEMPNKRFTLEQIIALQGNPYTQP